MVLGLTGEEILLAALGRAIARTIGEGVVPVDVAGHSGCCPAVLHVCAVWPQPTEVLGAVHRHAFGGFDSRHSVAAQPPSEIF